MFSLYLIVHKITTIIITLHCDNLAILQLLCYDISGSDKMTNEYEIVSHSKLRHINAFVIEITYRNFHLHSDFELIVALNGEGSIRLKNNNFAFKAGDALLINPNEIHEIDSSDNNSLKLMIIQFSRHFCHDYFPTLRNIYFETENIRTALTYQDYSEFIKHCTSLSVSYIKADDYFELECVSMLTKIILMLYKNMNYIVLDESKYNEQKKKSQRMNRITSYIDANYQYPIKLVDIAKQENITVTHLSHFFTESFGITFQEYLNSKRLEQALRLVQNKKLPLTAISQLSGFSDPKYLLKVFQKRFGYNFRKYQSSANSELDSKNNPKTIPLQKYYSKEDSLKQIERFKKANY